ncbi:MAG TPA: DUF188 domain-containing protein [Stellaceae bacterium]|nr:DUF188 domain-containing protein [Stellaceae bacterium]
MLNLYADTDAWPVLSQMIRTAQRHSLELYVATRDFFTADGHVHLILQEERINSGAWIAANIAGGDICVTGDPTLAASCIVRGAQALSPAGRVWTGEGDAGSILGSVANAQVLARSLEAAISARRIAHPVPPAAWRAPPGGAFAATQGLRAVRSR